MEISLNFITLTHLAAAFFGILSALVILYFGIKSYPVNQPLGIAQLSISLGIWVSFALVSQLIVQWPFLYRLGNIFVLIFIPMPFLHVVFYTQKRSWKWYDMLHALPLVMYLVDYWDVLVLPTADKLVLIQQGVKDLDLLGQFRESKFFGARFHQEFRTLLFSLYWVSQIVILIRWLRSQTSLTKEIKIWRNWIYMFLGCQFFIWFPFYLGLFGMDVMTTYHIVNSFSIVWILISSLSLFFFPAILYGPKLAEEYKRNSTINRTNKPITDADRHKLEEALHTLETRMHENRFFLTPGYSIHDFSQDIDLPVYMISKALSILKGLGFVDYINEKRIRYCIRKFDQGEWMNYTLEAVATECGFSNRNSLTKAFFKFQGESPSEYRRRFTKAI
jgi:AraC-like DNA-binding protein